jgi:hypothetical protein
MIPQRIADSICQHIDCEYSAGSEAEVHCSGTHRLSGVQRPGRRQERSWVRPSSAAAPKKAEARGEYGNTHNGFAEEDLHSIRRPRGNPASEEVCIFGPDRATKRQGGCKGRSSESRAPIFFVAELPPRSLVGSSQNVLQAQARLIPESKNDSASSHGQTAGSPCTCP